MPREGISRDEYLTKKLGSPERYKSIAGRVADAAAAEGLVALAAFRSRDTVETLVARTADQRMVAAE